MKEEIKTVKEEIKTVKEEIKTVKEMSSDVLTHSQNSLQISRLLTEREKNHFVRSHIPFRFIPEHTLGFPFG